MAGNKETRLEKVKKKVKPEREMVVFWNSYDNLHVYDAPPEEPGAREVTEEEIEQAEMEGKIVFRVVYVEKAPAE